MLKIGAHSPPQGATGIFKAVAEGLRAEAITWLWSENPGDTRPEWTNIVRMPTPEPREAANVYVNRTHGQIAAWYASGIPAIFVPGNEVDIEGPWNREDWEQFLPAYATELRARWAGIVLACPAYSVEHMDWMTSTLAGRFDYVCAHAYWPDNAPNLITDPKWGGAWQHARDTGKPVLVTEVNSNPTNPAQNVEWLSSLDTSVEAVTFFGADLAGSEWPFYNVTPGQATLIRIGWDHHAGPPPEPPPVPPPDPPPPPQPTSKFGFDDVPIDTYYRMLDAGSAGRTSPLRTAAIYAAMTAAARERNITIRLLCAWLRSENNMAVNISAGLLAAHNAAGIKYIGQPRATSGAKANPPVLAPGSEGFAPYCVFANWGDFFWTLAVNIQTILPDAYANGDLASIAAYYTSGDPNSGAGANKVLFFNEYSNRSLYPGGGVAPIVNIGLARVLAQARTYLGRTLTREGVPEFGACEMFVEEVLEDLGITRVRYYSAATHIDTLLQQGVTIFNGRPIPGAVLLLDRRFDPNGHICFAAEYPMVLTTYPGEISLIDGTRWYNANGYVGWYIPSGIGEGDEEMLPSDGTMDWGEARMIWESLGAVWNPDSAIFNAWLSKKRGGIDYGIPVGQEMGFESNSRVLLRFTSGFVASWTSQDNRVAWLGTLPAADPSASSVTFPNAAPDGGKARTVRAKRAASP